MKKIDPTNPDEKIKRISVIGMNDGMTYFAEKPSDEFTGANKEINLKTPNENLDAYRLFSIFTAEIIVQNVTFSR
ncbi:MAG: hypothetical protein M3139_00365 [Bacteroidota bacterium]|nr:hypothetical protein [Bacteroidota bacterium]